LRFCQFRALWVKQLKEYPIPPQYQIYSN